MAEKKENMQNVVLLRNINQSVYNLQERTRLIEERLNNLQSKLQVVSETNTDRYEDLKEKIEENKNQIKELEKEIKEVKNVMRRMIKEMGEFARESDLKVLEKYINMIDVTRLITKEDIRKIVKEELSKR